MPRLSPHSIYPLLLLPALFVLLLSPSAPAAESAPAADARALPSTAEWSAATLLDKIRGAWAGKCIGVVAGTPVEFRSCGKIYEGTLGWDLPTTIALLQDDLYVNMVFLEVVERHGIDATQKQFADAFRDSGFGLYHANLAARRNLLMGIPAPFSGRPPHNFHADDIDFQIEADFIGLICPGLAQSASEMAFKVGPIMNYGDGVYGGVFVANLYALAFLESDPLAVVEGALRSLPADSGYRRCIETVVENYRKDPTDWKAAWRDVSEKWDGDDRCPGGLGSPFNIDAKINGAYVAIGLLYGGKDPVKTVEIATRCGQDADCNPSTAVAVLGAMIGYSALPERWRREVESLGDGKFSYVPYTFDGVSSACLELSRHMARKTGGSVEGDRIRVRVQPPAAPANAERWDDGLIPVLGEPYPSKKWKWMGEWGQAEARGSRLIATQEPGASGEVEFEGEGVMLVGCFIESGGRIEVQLDDRPSTVVETYLFARGEMPHVYPQEALYYSGPIPSGKHRLRVSLLEKAHPESKGRIAGLQGVIVFRDREKIRATQPPTTATAPEFPKPAVE